MKLPVSVRIKLLSDERSFTELFADLSTACVTGKARIDGRKVFIYAMEHEPGPPADMFKSLQRSIRIVELARRERSPLVMLLDAPGRSHTGKGKTPLPLDSARLLADPAGVGRLYAELAQLAGRAPRVAALFGQTGASTVFPVALCDAIAMLESSGACIGRPDAVRHMVGETTDFETMGGARMHCAVSGLGDALFQTEPEAIAWARRYLAYFPARPGEPPPTAAPRAPARSPDDGDAGLIPAEPDRPFDVRPLLERWLDAGSLLELKTLYAREVITGLARIEGRPAGLVANNSIHRGGILFPETCAKISRFIALCDAFNIPMIFFADTPGFMIGAAIERAGIIKSAAQLFSAIANAVVPRLCVVVRRAHTAGLYAMAGPGFAPDGFLALPTAAISVFGRKAVERFAADREMPPAAQDAAREMLDACSNPAGLVAKGLLDAVTPIAELRPRLAAFLNQPACPRRPDADRSLLAAL